MAESENVVTARDLNEIRAFARTRPSDLSESEKFFATLNRVLDFALTVGIEKLWAEEAEERKT